MRLKFDTGLTYFISTGFNPGRSAGERSDGSKADIMRLFPKPCRKVENYKCNFKFFYTPTRVSENI